VVRPDQGAVGREKRSEGGKKMRKVYEMGKKKENCKGRIKKLELSADDRRTKRKNQRTGDPTF